MIKKILLLAICWQLTVTIHAQIVNQNDSLQDKNELQEVVVSASKFNERNSKVAASIKIIRNIDMQRLNMSNMANLLESSGLAFVQKSQQGGGSPVLRGFEASRVLLMVDGVRMNNAIYRAGHLQNVITVDPNILDRVEILYGPSSTLFGSDALGGVVNMFSKDPQLAAAGQKGNTHVKAVARYSSAIAEKMEHVDFNFSNQKWGSQTSVTYSDFGDIKMGEKADKDYPSFGLKQFYVERINGKDSAFINEDSFKQRPSSYHQLDVMEKVMYKPNDSTSHLLNLQVSNSSDIPRYDRLTEVTGNGLPRFAQWYYGPQKKYFGSYKFEKTNMCKLFQEMRIVASHQIIEESRYDRRFNNTVRNERIEKINVSGLTIDARKKMAKNEIGFGVEGQYNHLKSTARGLNVDDGAVTKITTRYPDGDNNMYYIAAYAQHLFKISDRFTFNDGLRLNYVNLRSTFTDTSFFHFPFATAEQSNISLSGNAGLTYSLKDNFKTALVFSTGFRSPNFDDLTKVFESTSGSLIVPNKDLKPEYTYNAEMNWIKYFSVDGGPFAASFGGSVFYTWFRNAIVTDFFKFNEQDSIFFNGVQSAVLASQNKAKAHLWGWNLNGHFTLVKNLKLRGTVTYTYGRYINTTAATPVEVPLDHIPPVFGRISLAYAKKNFGAELWLLMNGWKRIQDYSLSGEDNVQYATPDGMPSWTTINARLNYSITKKISAQAVVENIFDTRYRTFSSGISGAGRNFIIALKASL